MSMVYGGPWFGGLWWSMVWGSLSLFYPGGTTPLTLVDKCSVGTGLRSEGTRNGLKFWMERLIINLVGKLGLRGDSVSLA